MGKSSRKKLLRFKDKHPFCCFCGGSAPTETFDHVPPRALFIHSHWPEGYRFPACRSCNNSTSEADQLVAMLSRLGPDNAQTPDERADAKRQVQTFVKYYPRLAMETKSGLSPHAVRRAIRDGLVERIPGAALRDHSLIAVPSRVNECIKLFGAKVALALHYKHTGRIVPKEVIPLVRWYGRMEMMRNQIPAELFQLNGRPALTREGKSLQSQFDYLYEVSSDGMQGIYTITLRKTFLFGVVLNTNPPGEVQSNEAFFVRAFGR